MIKKMNVKKKINNNTVLVEDKGIEKVAMGKGIGFSAKEGQPLDVTDVDKIFVLNSKEKTKLFTEMVTQIPMKYIEFTEDIIQLISSRVDIPLDSNIYIALTDHIHFAVQRQKENNNVNAIMLPEMQLLYPKEYEIAEEVVEKINTEFHTSLGMNEIGFITMHIINAELNESNSMNSLKILEMTSDILSLIENEHGKYLDKESLNYQRLIIHIKFLVKRLIYSETTSVADLSFIDQSVKHTTFYQISLKIKEMVYKKYQVELTNEEMIYLAVHLARMK